MTATTKSRSTLNGTPFEPIVLVLEMLRRRVASQSVDTAPMVALEQALIETMDWMYDAVASYDADATPKEPA